MGHLTFILNYPHIPTQNFIPTGLLSRPSDEILTINICSYSSLPTHRRDRSPSWKHNHASHHPLVSLYHRRQGRHRPEIQPCSVRFLCNLSLINEWINHYSLFTSLINDIPCVNIVSFTGTKRPSCLNRINTVSAPQVHKTYKLHNTPLFLSSTYC